MNLFRSEEHARNWSQYDPANADGTMPLADYVALFSTGLFRERFSPDYLLRLAQFLPEWVTTLIKLGKTGAFWRLGGS